jgi:ATP-dependent exoDNAse (exonuclease V) beta subunit
VGETARCVGNVVHRWLQVIAEVERKGWTPERVGRMRGSFRNELAALGVVSAELEAATARVDKALTNALTDERGLWLLGPQTDARNEYRLTAMLNGERRQLVIDRTFTDAEGKRWIVDYKTSSHEGADKEAFLDREQARYRSQLERYAEVHGATGTGAKIRLGLYFPQLGGWRQWQQQEGGE